LRTVTFVTGNRHKFREAREILKGFGVTTRHSGIHVDEIQSESLREIARCAAHEAYAKLRRPLLVEDAGLFIEHLRGFPGPYSAYVHSTIGTGGVLKLMRTVADRKAEFRSVVAYCAGPNRVFTFTGSVFGEISRQERGRGWGYDPIFCPRGFKGRTYAELGGLKNEISHRKISLVRFARWFLIRS